MRREGIVSVLLGLIGLGLFTWLKVSHSMGDSAYVLLFALLSLTCLVVNGFSRLSELDLKNLRLTLTKIEEARADVYAKQRDVIRISMQLARMIAFLGAFQSRRMSAETLDIVKRWYRTQTCKLIDSLELTSEQRGTIMKYSDAFARIDEEEEREEIENAYFALIEDVRREVESLEANEPKR